MINKVNCSYFGKIFLIDSQWLVCHLKYQNTKNWDKKWICHLSNETYIIVFQCAQHFNLPEDSLSRNNSLEDIWHFLKSYSTPTAWICHRPDNPEGSIAYNLISFFSFDLRRGICISILLLLLWYRHRCLLMLKTIEFGAGLGGLSDGWLWWWWWEWWGWCEVGVGAVVLHGVERGEWTRRGLLTALDVVVACHVVAIVVVGENTVSIAEYIGTS